MLVSIFVYSMTWCTKHCPIKLMSYNNIVFPYFLSCRSFCLIFPRYWYNCGPVLSSQCILWILIELVYTHEPQIHKWVSHTMVVYINSLLGLYAKFLYIILIDKRFSRKIDKYLKQFCRNAYTIVINFPPKIDGQIMD